MGLMRTNIPISMMLTIQSCAEDMMNELKAAKARMDELKHQLSDMQRQTQDNAQALEGIDIILDKGKALEVWSRPR